ncbi:MAG: thiolase family protein [Acidobacteriota bacterium]
MTEAFIVDALRTPIGKRNGALSSTRPDELAASVLRALAARANVPPSDVEDVVMGCVTQVGEQGFNIARLSALEAGFPVEVPGTSVNRMCGSSQQAVNFAAQAIQSGAMDMVIGAGVESMSRVAMGSDGSDISHELTDRYDIIPQGLSAELVAERWQLTREAIDAFSLESHRRAVAAIEKKLFDGEILAVPGKDKEGRAITLSRDEGPRPDTSAEKLAGLQPAFKKDGVITAGNSSQISDGSAAVLIASEKKMKERKLRPRARIVATAAVGTDPTIMLTGPIPATRKVLAKAGMKIDQIDLFEVNEAFAPVVMAWERELGVDHAKVNVRGGAVALGHPLGASGARLVTTLLAALESEKKKYGLITMCIGFGMGTATIIERL